ncbi:MAG: NUDIX domain-containing protein [Bradyrhizobium sp.]|uniref:NUDIX hydrolase n=1 Tax=Bradyrhizobium sp. TaxID=376 RepID=UPI001E0DF630|nr:NUDIX domain-containing protein [Bradyrhizobium sp.]MBV9560326.1 NUDIX domain-containing protein [Bradyrhizobium sp.]
MTSSKTIRIAAAILDRADGMTLLVRKRGTTAFMQPGGKIEPGEHPALALCRELNEELGLSIDPAAPSYLGRYAAPAANEIGAIVEAEIFRVEIAAEVEPAAEIEEIVWVDPHLPLALMLAPLTRDHVLPLLWGGRRAN